MSSQARDRRSGPQWDLLHIDTATGIDRRVLELVAPHHAVSFDARAADGTRLACKEFGQGPDALVFCNGLGGTYRTFAEVFVHTLGRWRVLCHDYRGLFESGEPADPAAIDIATHADDVCAMLDARGIERAVLFGWSMGVQVALEFFRRHRERVRGLVLSSGVEGHLLDTAGGLPGARRWAPALTRAMRDRGAGVSRLLASVVTSEPVARAARGLGLVGRNSEVTLEHAALLFSTDPRVYWRMVEELQRHDAGAVLDTIDVPVLLLHGDGDVLTPVERGRSLRTRIKGSEIWVFAGCRHAVMLEYPERVARRLNDFLERRVLGGA